MSQKRALLVGIDAYPSRPLQNCVNDATEVDGLLQMQEYGFETTLLLNEQATRRAILTELQALFSGTSPLVLFYFAGHGIKTDFGTYLASADTDPVDVGLDLDLLTRYLRNPLAEQVAAVVILDCCHSGSATPRGDAPQLLRHLSNSDVSAAVTALPEGKVVLAACRPQELAYEEPSLHHGVFTFYLLEALYGEAADAAGTVTVPAVYDHVSTAFAQRTKQTPVFRGDIAGRLVLGQGLTPRDRKQLPEEELIQLERQAEQVMNEYFRALPTEIEERRVAGYQDACSLLQPRLRWFDRITQLHPQISKRRAFASAYQSAQRALADLAHLDVGTKTALGAVTALIGAGQFGTVWRVSPEQGGDIAYKVYHPAELGNAEKLHRFQRGYRAMAQLSHPYIVRVTQFIECPIGFAMDFIDGPNAREYAGGAQTPVETIAQLLTVAETLRHAHGRGVVHRDVKPENVILRWKPSTEAYEPYLTDFDLAWFTTATQLTKTTGIGTILYAAPEQLQLRADTGISRAPTVDVYAFGQLFFFLLTSRDPEIGGDNVTILRQRLTAWASGEAARLAADLYTATIPHDPRKRIQSFVEICDRLYGIRRELMGAVRQDPLEMAKFVRELAFSIGGLEQSEQAGEGTFYSLSTRTRIIVTYQEQAAGHLVVFTLCSVVPPFIEGLSHKQMIERINRRIDAALHEFAHTTRRSGSQAPFETLLYVDNLEVTMGGVELARRIITRAIDCIEGG